MACSRNLNQINADFVRDVMQPATRVNYASNMAYIHGLEAMVSDHAVLMGCVLVRVAM